MFISKYTTLHRGFTLVEIMSVIVVIGIIGTALTMGVQPYMKRSRDTKRVSSMLQYTNIIEGYEKNFDAFPSNYGSGDNPLEQGYCLSELGRRTYNSATNNAMQFGKLNTGDTSSPPIDPSNNTPISPCIEPRSFFYSKLDYGTNNELFIIAAQLEIQESGNYGTGSDLVKPAKADDLINAKKSTIPNGAPDNIFVVTRVR